MNVIVSLLRLNKNPKYYKKCFEYILAEYLSETQVLMHLVIKFI